MSKFGIIFPEPNVIVSVLSTTIVLLYAIQTYYTSSKIQQPLCISSSWRESKETIKKVSYYLHGTKITIAVETFY